jgi:hypothetical protein
MSGVGGSSGSGLGTSISWVWAMSNTGSSTKMRRLAGLPSGPTTILPLTRFLTSIGPSTRSAVSPLVTQRPYFSHGRNPMTRVASGRWVAISSWLRKL